MTPAIYDPIKKLDLLRGYMDYMINRQPGIYVPFSAWLLRKYPRFVYGTIAYYKSIASNCFYCRKEFTKDDFPTDDHFFPKSKDSDGTYFGVRVICCRKCNEFKGAQHPDTFISKMTLAHIRLSMLKYFTEKELRRIAKNVNIIKNDVLFNRVKRVYYVTRYKDVIPKDFYRIDLALQSNGASQGTMP